MAGIEYAHQLGQMLSMSTEPDERVTLCGLLAATGSVDAHAYLLEALSEETDERVIAAIKAALTALGQPRCD